VVSVPAAVLFAVHIGREITVRGERDGAVGECAGKRKGIVGILDEDLGDPTGYTVVVVTMPPSV
jgi:hypothetical protein